MRQLPIPAILCLTLIASLPIAAAETFNGPPDPELSPTPSEGQGCTNYGNQVQLGSSYSCSSGSGCDNYGVIINIGSAYTCTDGACDNYGIVVNVGGEYCGTNSTMVCYGANCATTPISAGMSEGAMLAAAKFPDCPRVNMTSLSEWHLECGDPNRPCGIGQEPACWTVRFLCMNGIVLLVKAYNNQMPPDKHHPSTCQGQPSWPGNGTAMVCGAWCGTTTMVSLGAMPTTYEASELGPGCLVSAGNCTGECTLNIVGYCAGTCTLVNAIGYCAANSTCSFNVGSFCNGHCTVNVGASCQGTCIANIVAHCASDDMCVANVLGTCFGHPPPVAVSSIEAGAGFFCNFQADHACVGWQPENSPCQAIIPDDACPSARGDGVNDVVLQPCLAGIGTTCVLERDSSYGCRVNIDNWGLLCARP